MPRSLDLDRLQQFRPTPSPSLASGRVRSVGPNLEVEVEVETVAAASGREVEPRLWPSREPIRDGQISIKAPLDVIDRFRAMCRDDRRTYADMLGILMDGYEKR